MGRCCIGSEVFIVEGQGGTVVVQPYMMMRELWDLLDQSIGTEGVTIKLANETSLMA